MKIIKLDSGNIQLVTKRGSIVEIEPGVLLADDQSGQLTFQRLNFFGLECSPYVVTVAQISALQAKIDADNSAKIQREAAALIASNEAEKLAEVKVREIFGFWPSNSVFRNILAARAEADEFKASLNSTKLREMLKKAEAAELKASEIAKFKKIVLKAVKKLAKPPGNPVFGRGNIRSHFPGRTVGKLGIVWEMIPSTHKACPSVNKYGATARFISPEAASALKTIFAEINQKTQ